MLFEKAEMREDGVLNSYKKTINKNSRNARQVTGEGSLSLIHLLSP